MAVTSQAEIVKRIRGAVQRARTIKEDIETRQIIRQGGEPDPQTTGGTLQHPARFESDPARRTVR